MKNLRKLFGLFSIAALIACAMASCEPLPPDPVIPVTGVSLNKTSIALPVGGTETLYATVSPSDATNKAVSWSSSAPSIATVSSSGTVTGIAEGSAIITVSTADGNKTAACAVTVGSSNVAVTGVSLNKTETTMLVGGGKEALYATVLPSNATNQNVTWSSSAPDIVSVTSNGQLASDITIGRAIITVTTADGNKTATCTVTVSATPVAVTGVSLNKNTLSLSVGGSETLTAAVSPSNATNQNVNWSSSAPAVATVAHSGKVTGIAAGSAVITASSSDGGKTATCNVTVSGDGNTTVTGVALNKSALSLAVGGTEALIATVLPSSAMNKAVTWSSSNTEVATISSSGVVTGVAAGSTVITVSSSDGGKTATCNVTVTGGGSDGLVFTSIAAFKAWLDAQPTNTVGTAYNVKLNVSDLGGSYDTTGSAGNALFTNDKKYINIDLSGSTFTSIGQSAFYYCLCLASITIPDSVTTIGFYAFNSCYSLTAINIGSANTAYSSQDGVLYDKAKTSLISYPGGKTGAFTIPNSVISIEAYAFCRCASLTSVFIPNSVSFIGNAVFLGCKSLTAINVDPANTVYSSQDGVLFNKAKTKLINYPEKKAGASFTIPGSVTIIGYLAFHSCSNLTSITIPNGVIIIEDGDLQGNGAFYSCSNLASITIPNSVNTIGNFAFNSCHSLTNVTIPNSVTTIGNAAFMYCRSLTSITIPDNVTTIGDYAFIDCTGLTSITFQGPIPSNGFSTVAFGTSGNSSYIGDLRDKFYATDPTNGTPGTYTRASGGTTWTKQ